MIGWFFLILAVACHLTTRVRGSTLLDLNQATASLRVTEPLHNVAPQIQTGSQAKVPIASVFVASMALLSIIALYIFKPSVFAKATNYARMAARNMLVYALTDRKAAPGIFQEGKARKSSTEGKKLNAPMPRSRSDFSLSSSLDTCSLVVSTRQEIAPVMDNTLMRATLDRPTIDSYTTQVPAQVPATLFEAQLEKLNLEESAKQDRLKKIKELSNRGIGKKPDIRRLKNLDLIPHGKKKVRKLKGFKLDEAVDELEEEHDWESDPRVSPVLGGDNMEGPDAGCAPLHTLYLPRSAKKAKDYGICGRSLITVDNEPTFAELFPPPSRSVVENKKFLGWNIKKASKQTVRKNALRKDKKATSSRNVPAFSLE
jgi:hypothetical protein